MIDLPKISHSLANDFKTENDEKSTKSHPTVKMNGINEANKYGMNANVILTTW